MLWVFLSSDPADPADPVRSSADGDGNGGGADTPTPLSSVDSLRAWHDQSRDEQSLALLVGAVIASEMRQAVSTEASVSCSAGVAQNKVLWHCDDVSPTHSTIPVVLISEEHPDEGTNSAF